MFPKGIYLVLSRTKTQTRFIFINAFAMKPLAFAFLSLLFFAVQLDAQRFDHFPGEILVRFEKGVQPERVVQRLSRLDNQPTGLRIVEPVSPPFQIWLLAFDHTAIDEQEMLQVLRRQPEVLIAQFNHVISMRDTIPNDPNFGQQWHWRNIGQSGGLPDADVDADEAWDITTGGFTATGDEIVVCVIEGTQRNHPDLVDNIWFNQHEIPGNGIDDDGNGYVDDYNGWNVETNNDVINAESHGTAVSGMIGAVGNNGLQITGMNWRVKIMNVDFNGVSEANSLAAYTYPYVMRKLYNESGGALGAFVVATNASWGIDNGKPEDAPLWCAFYDSLGAVGILNCGATTNSNVNVDVSGDLPTACPSDFMVAVTATNRSDVRTFSGYGVENIDVAAPGQSVTTLTLNGPPGPTSGTSFASPLVAGLIGLLYSAPCPWLGTMAKTSPKDAALLVRDALFAGVDSIPALANEVKYGRVNARKAIEKLLERCGSCPPPFGPIIENTIDTSTLVSWAVWDSILNTSLLFRPLGDTVWSVVDTVVSPYLLTGLQPCTPYQIALLGHCNDTITQLSMGEFTTDGCCVPPSNLIFEALTDTSVSLSWNDVLAAQSYNVFVTWEGGADTIAGWTQTHLDLDNLLPCTKYTVYIQTVCDTGATPDLALVVFKTVGCGACLDLAYCPSSSANANEEWIGEVQIGSFVNTSGSDGGYGDYTSQTIELATYGIYPVKLTPKYAGNSFPEWFAIWVDLDQSGSFESEEKLFDSGGTVTSTVTGLLAIPPTALTGPTRLRVSMRWNNQPQPCMASFNFGEVEDYCVNISKGLPPTCMPSDSLFLLDLSYTNATLAWTTPDNSLSYVLQIRPLGDTLWEELPVPGNSYEYIGLQACTSYEFRVKSDCGFVDSDFSMADTFTTLCYPPCDEIPSALDTLAVLEHTATINWNSTPAAESYLVLLRLAGDTAFIFLATNDTIFTLSNLESCTNYEFAVVAICPGEGESPISELFAFKTDCPSGLLERLGGITTIDVAPNPFGDFIDLRLRSNQPMEITYGLLSSDGRQVHAGQVWQPSGEALHRLSGWDDLPAGVYLLRLETPHGTGGMRLVKKPD